MASELLMTGGIVVLLLKVTLVLTLSLLWARSLARASASTRHLLWLTSLSLLLLVPLVSSVAPALRVLPVPFDPTELAQGGGTGPLADLSPVLDVAAPVESEAAPPAVAPDQGARLEGTSPAPARSFDPDALVALLLAVWGIGSILLLGRLALSEVLLRRALRRTTPLEGSEWMAALCEAADRLDLAELPDLVMSDDAAMPFACGFRRPTIVLPRAAETWGPSRRSAVLFHELAHVRRRDLVGHTVARLVCALYWVHPMVWAAARRLRAESERACDDLALSVGIRPSEYADHILQIVTAVRGPFSPAVAVPFADRRELEGRVLAILDPVLHRGRPSGANVGALAALLLCGIAFSALAPVDDQAVATSRLAALSEAPDPHSSLLPHSPSFHPEPDAPALGEPEEHVGAAAEVEVEVEPHEIHIDAIDESGRELKVTVKNEANPTAAQLRQTGDVSVLTTALASDPSPLVRKTAAWSLARFDDATGVAALLRALLTDGDAEVREMSAWALASDRADRGVDAFLRALTQDASDDVRATAAWALGGMRRPPATVLPALVRALGDPSAEVRERAAWGIGSIGPETAPPALYGSALSDADEDVRRVAAWALSEIRDPRATSALLARMDTEEDEDVLEFVSRALLLTTPRSSEALNRMLRSENAQLRAWAIATAGGGSPPFWPAPWPWPQPRPNP